MARPKKADPSIDIHLRLPLSFIRELDVILFSTTEGRIPQGIRSEFFLQAGREHLKKLKAAQLAQEAQDAADR